MFPLTLFPFHPSPPSLFFRVPCFSFPRTFKHVQVPPYFRSFILFWVDQIYIHSIKMTRLFLLRKYEVQMQALGDGGNRGHDIHTYVPPARSQRSVMLTWWSCVGERWACGHTRKNLDGWWSWRRRPASGQVVVRGRVALAGAFVIHACDSDVTQISQSCNSGHPHTEAWTAKLKLIYKTDL